MMQPQIDRFLFVLSIIAMLRFDTAEPFNAGASSNASDVYSFISFLPVRFLVVRRSLSIHTWNCGRG